MKAEGDLLMTSLTIEPLHEDFGGRVGGIDLGEPLTEPAVTAIHAAIDHYSLLWFPDQPFDWSTPT